MPCALTRESQAAGRYAETEHNGKLSAGRASQVALVIDQPSGFMLVAAMNPWPCSIYPNSICDAGLAPSERQHTLVKQWGCSVLRATVARSLDS